jgi:hypothetical protein
MNAHSRFFSAIPQLLPLSKQQLHIWHAQTFNPRIPGLSIAECMEIKGMVHPTPFTQAVGTAVAETEALHLCFCETGQGPYQFVAAKTKWIFAFLDQSHLPDPYTAAKEWMQEDFRQFVAITEGPLFSIALFRCAGDRYLYYFRCHRILAGKFDRYLLTKRIAALYAESWDPVLAQRMCFRLNSMRCPEETCFEMGPMIEFTG